MWRGDGEDGFRLLRVHLELFHFISERGLRKLGHGRRCVARLVERGGLRRLAPGLYVDPGFAGDARWVLLSHRAPAGVVTLETAAGLHGLRPLKTGLLHVALRHGRHAPRLGEPSVQFHFLRVPWEDEDLEPCGVPGLERLSLSRFALHRLFAELAQAGRFRAAVEAGRALLARGFTQDLLSWVLGERGVTPPVQRPLLKELARGPPVAEASAEAG